MQKMVRRRFSASHDLLLLEEVDSVNPYFARNKKDAWTEVADALNKIPEQMFGPGKGLDYRACELRTQRLLESHEADDLRSRCKSGTEEQYQQINALLVKISQAKKDAPVSKEDKPSKVAKNAEKAVKEAELAAANEIILDAGEETYSPMSIQQEDELTDEQMVERGGLDPGELNRGQPPQDDSLNGDTAGPSGKKAPRLPERKKRKFPIKNDDDDLIAYMTKSDDEKKRIRAMELEHKKDVRVLELQSQKEIKELELAHQKEMEDKRQETEKMRITAEAQKWDALLALIGKR